MAGPDRSITFQKIEDASIQQATGSAQPPACEVTPVSCQKSPSLKKILISSIGVAALVFLLVFVLKNVHPSFRVGSKHFDIIWPGWFLGTPGLLMMLVYPSILLFALFEYASMPLKRKFLYVPLCLIGPFLITGLLPIPVTFFVTASNSTAFENYQAVAMMFGDFSNYVWTILTGGIVYAIYSFIKKRAVKTSANFKS